MPEYIEREALIRKVKAFASDVIFRGVRVFVTAEESCNPVEWTKGYEQGVKDVANIIAGQPAADEAPVVHGRWIHKGQRVHLGVNWWACSACGDESGAQWMRYCPNCGARMDGE